MEHISEKYQIKLKIGNKKIKQLMEKNMNMEEKLKEQEQVIECLLKQTEFLRKESLDLRNNR